MISVRRVARAAVVAAVVMCVSLVSTARAAQAGDFYYEVWRNTTCDLTSATRIGEWLTATAFTDNTAVPGGNYYYWVRGLEAQTVHNYWGNLSFDQEEWFTCPIAIERGKPSPIKAKVRLGGGIFGVQIQTLYSEVREEDVFVDDTIDSWSVGPLWVDVTSYVTREWTRDVDIGPAEPVTGTAEVYHRSRFGNSLWLPSPVVNVEMRSQMPPGPSDLSVTLQGGKNVITWSSTIENTAFSAPSRVPQYKALIICSSDPYSGYAASMKSAFLAWDETFWQDENIVALEDPTREQVEDQIAALTQDADFFFFAYAGHGAKNGFVQGQPESVPPALTDGDEAVVWEANDPLLGRVETWIVDDELTSWLSACDGPVLSVIQSCYSGGFWNGSDEGDLESLGLSALMAACPEDETVAVSTPLWPDLLDGCGLGVADTSGDGIITLGEWYAYAKTGDSVLFGDLADLQLFAVPEPATLALLALGGLAVLLRKRH